MQIPTFYDELKGWQGGIGALLGFAALFIGAMWNFRLNRQRDAALRAEEALSVAVALYVEIVLLRKEVASVARFVAAIEMRKGTNGRSAVKIDNHFLQAFPLSEPMLYKALASKIGLLSADLALAITKFHANFQEAKTWLPLLVENSERNYSYGPSVVLDPARAAVLDIIPALRRIEKMAGIEKPAEALDLGKTDAMIEIAEEMSAFHGQLDP